MGNNGQLPSPVQGYLPAKPRSKLTLGLVLLGVSLPWIIGTLLLDIDIHVKCKGWPNKLENPSPERRSDNIVVQRRDLYPRSNDSAENPLCKPFLPVDLLQNSPPSGSDPDLSALIEQWSQQLATRVAQPDMDSITVGIVNTDGLIWSQGFGRARANGTDQTPPNEHTIYRIGSCSKLFATLEGFILRDKGVLHWDDPVQKFLTNFTYNTQSWKEYINHEQSNDTDSDPITLRQLASHMSGIGRDLPAENYDSWPPQNPSGVPSVLPTLQGELESVAQLPLIAPSYSFPAYSNTGFSILGASLAAADNSTYTGIVARDVFTPLAMNGSSFYVTDQNRAQLAIPRDGTEIDIPFADSLNAAGGQYSSVSDLAKALQSLLTPNRQATLISPTSRREWMRPMHVFQDAVTESGLVWEIYKTTDSHGREMRYYTKSGDLIYSHAEMVINPVLQYGIVVLLNGANEDAPYLAEQGIALLQPAFESILEKRAKDRYGGTWYGQGNDTIAMEVSDGTLWITKWLVNGTDFVNYYRGTSDARMAMWSTGRSDEFRVPTGSPTITDTSCFLSWATIDQAQSHHAPIDLIYFEEKSDGLVLQFPSANVTMHR